MSGLSAEDLAHLRSLRASGASSVTINGQTINLRDGADLDRLIAQAERSDPTSLRNGRALQTRVAMDMSGFIS